MTNWTIDQLLLIADGELLQQQDDPVGTSIQVAAMSADLEFTAAFRRYQAARKRGDLDEMVAATSNIDLRRYVLSELVRKPGRPRGTGNTKLQHRARAARKYNRRILKIWREHYRTTRRHYPPSAEAIVEEMFRRFRWRLPENWQKER